MENKEDIAAALAAGGEIEYMNKNGEWHVAREYRVKPKRPEYPASTISDAELRKAWIEDGCGSYLDFDKAIARACADAGLRHAFETGTAVPKAEHEAALAQKCRQVRTGIETLYRIGYSYEGGELWKPPLGQKPSFVVSEHALNIVNVGAIYGSKKALDYVANCLLDFDPAKRGAAPQAAATMSKSSTKILYVPDPERELALANEVAKATYNAIRSNGNERKAYGDLNIDLLPIIRKLPNFPSAAERDAGIAARELAIAEAVRQAVSNLPALGFDKRLAKMDLPGIIASVK